MGDADGHAVRVGGKNVLVSQSPTTPQEETWRECPPEPKPTGTGLRRGDRGGLRIAEVHSAHRLIVGPTELRSKAAARREEWKRGEGR